MWSFNCICPLLLFILFAYKSVDKFIAIATSSKPRKFKNGICLVLNLDASNVVGYFIKHKLSPIVLVYHGGHQVNNTTYYVNIKKKENIERVTYIIKFKIHPVDGWKTI